MDNDRDISKYLKKQSQVQIHTIVYNSNKIKLKFNDDVVHITFWNYEMILELIKTKYSEYLVYFKRLVLNKSRENFSKYIIIKEFGGIFISQTILKLIERSDIDNIIATASTKYDMVFWLESQEYQELLMNEIFDIENTLMYGPNKIIRDDIFKISNPSNSFINYLLEQIDKTIIPQNQYQNKIYLGNVFLSKTLNKFYESKLDIGIHSKFSIWFDELEKKYDHANLNQNKFERSIYMLKILNNSIKKSKNKKYQMPELIDPEINLIEWEPFWKFKKYFENILTITMFQQFGLVTGLKTILIVSLINWVCVRIIRSSLNVQIKSAQIDSKIFFNWKKYKFLSVIKSNWKIIREEALNVMKNAPKLNISRSQNDWYGANEYYNNIKNQYGWIRSWDLVKTGESEYETTCESICESECESAYESTYGNSQWLNYGLVYFGDIFGPNANACPNTLNILNQIVPKINICGFSWMMGGCELPPHTDITGISSGSLALHLGLVVSGPIGCSKLVIKNEESEFVGITEEEGKMFVFDATYEHYAYNQSNEDRVILYVDFQID